MNNPFKGILKKEDLKQAYTIEGNIINIDFSLLQGLPISMIKESIKFMLLHGMRDTIMNKVEEVADRTIYLGYGTMKTISIDMKVIDLDNDLVKIND